MLRTALFVTAALVVTACQSGPPSKPIGQSAAATATANLSSALKGRAFYMERIALPPGATLEVQLIADSDSDTPATIAQETFSNLRGPPFDFALPYDPARIQAGADYSLRAILRDASGELEFVTPTRVAVTPGSSEVVEFRLQRSTRD